MVATPSQITIDIIEDARWQEVNGLVVGITRMAIVQGLDPTLPFPADMLLYNARAFALLPSNGSTHPWQPQLTLREREFSALGHGIAHIMLKYKRDDVGQPPGDLYMVRGGSTSEQIETQLDRQGNQIVLTHQGKQQGGEIHPFESRSELQVSWKEQSAFPGDLTRAFTNKVNAATPAFKLDLLAPARTWRCTDVSFELDDATRSPPMYRFQASFLYNPDKFDPQVVYIDPETGRPPPALVSGQGYKTITWYGEANFNDLLP